MNRDSFGQYLFPCCLLPVTSVRLQSIDGLPKLSLICQLRCVAVEGCQGFQCLNFSARTCGHGLREASATGACGPHRGRLEGALAEDVKKLTSI